MGIIVSVINNKGGCGKSTTTYNLADALGRKNRRVLVIDMDPQCNTTSILLPANSQRTMALVLAQRNEDSLTIDPKSFTVRRTAEPRLSPPDPAADQCSAKR